MTGRDIQTLFVPVSPGQRDEHATGRLTLPLGAELGRDGMTAGLCFAAAMTTRASEGGIDGTLPVHWPDIPRTLQWSSAGAPLDFQFRYYKR